MKKMIWSKARCVAAIGWGVVMLLAGCGGGSGGSATAVPDPGSSNSTVTTPTPTPVAPTLSLLAGQPGGPGNVDGPSALASLGSAWSLTQDRAGNWLIADGTNNSLRKLTRDGVVSTVLGGVANINQDNVPTAFRVLSPRGVVVDSTGSIFWLNNAGGQLLKLDTSGQVRLVAGGGVSGLSPVSAADVATVDQGSATALAIDGADNLYVAMTYGVRRVSPAGVMTTLAGRWPLSGATDGAGQDARFSSPAGIATDGQGNVYVAESSSGRVRKVTPDGVVSTVASGLGRLTGIASDGTGVLFVTDVGAGVVRRIGRDGVVTAVTGSDGVLGNGSWPSHGIALDGSNIVVTDPVAGTLWSIAANGVAKSLIGSGAAEGLVDGDALSARFAGPSALAVDSSGVVYVADAGNNAVRAIDRTGRVRTLFRASSGKASDVMSGLAWDGSGLLLIGDAFLSRVDAAGNRSILSSYASAYRDGAVGQSAFATPRQMVAVGSDVFVADAGNGLVRRIGANGVVTTLAGGNTQVQAADGQGFAASFGRLWGIAADPQGNLWLADNAYGTLRKVTPQGMASTLALRSGTAAAGVPAPVTLSNPQAMVADERGNLYVVSAGTNTIQKITPAGEVTTVVGQDGKIGFVPGALPGVLNGPRGLALVGRTLYISMQNAVVQVTDLP